MRIQKSAFILAFASLLAVYSPETASAADKVNAQNFVAKAASSDQFEIQSSQMALTRSQNPAIQKLAQQMIADHTQSTQNLKSVLQASQLPPPPAVMLPTDQHKLDQLANSKNFDSDYISVQQDTHEKAVALFQNYSTAGDNAALKGFAAETLPVIQGHDQMLKHAPIT